MEKIKNKLKEKVKDEIATYAILLAICITFIATISIDLVINNKSSVITSSNITENYNEITNKAEVETVENLTSVEEINSIEELQKLNEKELEEAKTKEEKNKKEIDSTPKYYIKVNYGAQVVTVYTKDSKGKYTVPVKAMVCSTGTYTPTSGVYKTPNRFRWLNMIGDVYAQYCTQIVGDILFHSVPYLEKYDHSSLEYWEYDKLGTRCSLGCIRLTCKDAKWIYDNCKLGTKVEFYSSSNPGPLGKPSARKISSAPSYVRGWDPTDPASNNPWKEYLKNKNKDNNKDKNSEKDKNNNKDNNKENTIKEPENTNTITNDIGNEITNDTINEIVNETINEVTNTTTNETNNNVEEENSNIVSNIVQ